MNLVLNDSATLHALLVAPRSGSTEVAAFVTRSGDRVMCNANLNPFSPVDGTPMQLASSKRVRLDQSALQSMVKIGHCTACDNDIRSTASFADVLDTAGVAIHCPFCCASVQPNIDSRKLITALAEEYDEGGEGSEEPEDTDEDDEDSETADTDSDDDDEDVDSTDADEPDPDEDDEPDDETDDETAGVMARLRRKAGNISARRFARANEDDEDEDGTLESDDDEDADSESEGVASDEYQDDDSQDGDGQDSDEGEDPDSEFASVVRTLRRKVVSLGLASDEDDDDAGTVEPGDESDTDPGSETDMSDDSDVEPDDELMADNPGDDEDFSVDDAVASLRRYRTRAHLAGDRPTAGRGVDRNDINDMNDQARAALRQRRGSRADGNANLKGIYAMAGLDRNIEGDVTVGEDGHTPGTNSTEGESLNQLGTPGSNRNKPRDHDSQEVTPGTNETSGDAVVNWVSDKVELIATSNRDIRWVFANGRPVARLLRSQASAGIGARWDDIPTVEKSFKAVCARGLPRAEAAEFGYAPHAFRVKASEVMRNAMRRQSELSTANAQRAVVRGIDRYKQSLRAALVATLKGTFPDTKNHMRDALVASLSRLSVAEPRSVIDTAMAASVEPFLVAVFRKADEIAEKPDVARDEIAGIVASASYQARVDDGALFSSRLSAGSSAVVSGGFRQTQEAASGSGEPDQASLVRRALGSIRS